jgi:glycosyltransferase involved in cell wall biosynthesis
MWKTFRISVVFPAYNEEEYISKAVADFRELGVVDEIVVVDNNSKDRTAAQAAAAGARVIQEAQQGYGCAIRRGLKEASGDLIVVCEPDGTFQAKDLWKFLAYCEEFDFVLGTRTSKALIWNGANMGYFLKWGNWAVGKLLEFLYNGPSLTDVGCTYRLIHREALLKIQDQFRVRASHFSPEMMLVAIKNGLSTVEIPVHYRPRVGVSKITGNKLRAFSLGLKMIALILGRRIAP